MYRDFLKIKMDKMITQDKKDIGLSIINHHSNTLYVTTIDTSYKENSFLAELETIEITHQLTPRELNEFNINKHVAEFLNDNVVTTEIPNTKISVKIQLYSNLIAQQGRIGKSNTILLNDETFKNIYDICNSIDQKVVINDYIEDNVIYLIRNNELYQPGYKYIFHVDLNNNQYYSDIIKVGLYPEYQCCKLKIRGNIE